MKPTIRKGARPLFAKTALSTLIALSIASTHAQEVEEVLVTGQFQRDLQNAIELKRNSDTIVDAISADDIDSQPALSLGEALQAVPGIQLNREGERRESSVNLRGLPSGFIRTTSNGQSIAAPKRGSQNDIFGAANPFGAFDPSIFNGIAVIKTQDASMQEGGIAGAIDLRLPKALEKENSGALRLGFRSEELAGELDHEISANGSVHLIEDVLAVTGAIGFSEQNWRRDSLRVNRYDTIQDGVNFAPGSTDLASLADYKDRNNLPADATIFYPSENRQLSEINSGQRLSFAGNVQYQATDALKLGASVIYTDREMDDNRLEQLEIRSREYTHVGVTPIGAPNPTGLSSDDGSLGFTVPRVELDNTRYFYDNRQYNFFQSSEAFIFDAEWTNDEWTIDGAITLSEAENIWDEILISPRSESSSQTDAVFYSGESTPENWSLQLSGFDESINFDEWVFNAASRELVTNSGAVPTSTPGGAVLLLTGTYEVVDSGLDSIEANFERVLNDEGITSVSFGVRSSVEELNSSRLRISGADVDPNGIFTNEGKIPPSSQGDFFDGKVPGAAGVGDGWYSFDFDEINSALISTIRDDISTLAPRGIEEAVRLPNGYIARANELGKGFDFDSEIDINAIYGMMDFSYGIMRGNVGLRYVDTNIDTVAPVYERSGSTITARLPDEVVTSSYDHLLPSANLNFDLSDELILRLAYNETIVRPNLRAASPQTQVTVSPGEIDIVLPGSEVEPFEAASFDASLEWYTNDSGLISVAAYYKAIDNFFEQTSICSEVPGFDLGTISRNSAGQCISSGNGDDVTPDTIVNQTAWANTDRTIDVSGFEISLQQKLSMLPFPWDGFGGTINYTNVSQSSDRDEDGEELLITGVSDESYNFIAFYERESFGVRLSYNWRSDYDIIASNTLFGEGQSTVKAVGRLDLSAYYDVTDQLKLSLKGYNLSESIYEEYQSVESQIRRADFEGRTWVLSASLSF